MVLIGSHSHLFCAVHLSSGHVLWSTRLGDRVESSACLSACGRFGVVGADTTNVLHYVKTGKVIVLMLKDII